MDPAAAAKLLAEARDVTLLGHVRPDADALGSALALGMVLAERGARVRVTCPATEQPPDSLRYLDSAGLLVPATQTTVDRTLVVLDSSSQSRLGELSSTVDTVREAGGVVLVVDHHPNNTRFGTHHLIDETAEATAVLVLRLIDALGVELSASVAECLYAGLATDTSWFRRASPATHELAARLLTSGVDPQRAAYQLTDSHPYGYLEMLGSVLRRASLRPDAAGGRGLVHTAVHLAETAGVRPEDTESVIDILRGTVEADVAMVAKELAPQQWTVSLRARTVDVGAVAARLGGGGHRLAAGYPARGGAEDVVAALLDVLAAPEP